jgi:hypothetical protein
MVRGHSPLPANQCVERVIAISVVLGQFSRRSPILPAYSTLFGDSLVDNPLQVGKIGLELVKVANIALQLCSFGLRTKDYGMGNAEWKMSLEANFLFHGRLFNHTRESPVPP